MASFRVDTPEESGLRLRTAPVMKRETIKATIPEGHLVEVLDETRHPWWRVRVALSGQSLEGFAFSRYLLPADTFPAPNLARAPEAVHLRENRADVTRATAGFRAFPLGEPGQPRRTAASPHQLRGIIDWLDVESNARYAPGQTLTFCNIYAYDYCYLAGVYLPRVWWSASAVERFARGELLTPLYGSTLIELGANSLFNWLNEFGDRFGWQQTFSFNDAQDAANRGEVVILAAQRANLNQSGHIVAIAPEGEDAQAFRSGGVVRRPVQSEAGARNRKLGVANSAWWADARFRSFALFVHP